MSAMNFKFIFNHHYVSCKAYFKMSVIIENKGMFMIVYNYATKKVQCQRVSSTANYHKLVYGSRPCAYNDINEVMNNWYKFNDEIKEAYIYCFNYIFIAFAKFKRLGVLTTDEINETYNKITEVRNQFFDFKSQFSVEPVLNDKDVENYVAESTKEVIEEQKRKFISMAKIINDNNLNEVVSGNFYHIIDTLSFNGNDYVTLDIDGEHRTLSKNRLKLVTVFTDKPC